MIYLLRHGLDDEKYIGGWSNVDLTNEGIGQIKEAAQFIKKNNLKINNIYSSDITRAITTSKIIEEYLKIKPVYTKKLRELNKGLLMGLEINDAKRKYPEYFDNPTVNTKCPNGESMNDFYMRIKNNLGSLLKNDNSLLITHRGVINMIYFILNNQELDMNKRQFGVDHGSIHEYNPLTNKIRKIR